MDSPLTSPDRPIAGFLTPGAKTYSPFGAGRPVVLGGMDRTPGCDLDPFTSPPPSRKFFHSPPFSPPFSPLSPADLKEAPSPGGDSLRRGRPRANMITSLMERGSVATDGAIRCVTCSRVFPREKSLQAHMRTHTGERPYMCDFPGCTKAFCQSGQLKTHQRLHSGEKPFVCSAEGCAIRFTHANRHCPDHPSHALVRDEEHMPAPSLDDVSMSPAVQSWFHRYMLQRQERTPNKTASGLTQSCTKRSLYPDLENQYQASKRHTLVIGKLDAGDDCEEESEFDKYKVSDFDKIAGEELVYADVDAEKDRLKDSKMIKLPFQLEDEPSVLRAIRKVAHEETVLPLIGASELEAQDLRVTKTTSVPEFYKLPKIVSPVKTCNGSVAVSVIRRVGLSPSPHRVSFSPSPLASRCFPTSEDTAGAKLSHSPQKVFLLSNSVPSAQRFGSFCLQVPTVSPIKSPRKQAALALIQLSSSDIGKRRWLLSE